MGDVPKHNGFGETPQECFDRHFIRCLFKEGDNVIFKKPKRNRIHGVIEHIETDINKMQWIDGFSVPRYICVRVPVFDKKTNQITGLNRIWTTESKLTFES